MASSKGTMERLFLLQLAGMSGTGKSTLAREIARRTGAVVVDVDVLKSAALEVGAGWDLSTRVGYEASRAVAEDVLRQGRSVVLDSPCRFAQIVEGGMGIAARRGAAYGYVECVLGDEAELRRRLRQRPTLRSQGPDLWVPPPDAPVDAYAGWKDESGGYRILPSYTPPEPVRWLRVDTSRPVENYLTEVLEYLEMVTTGGG